MGEGVFKPGEERGVVKGPWRRGGRGGGGGVGIPERKRERVGDSEPIAVDFEICGSVGGYECYFQGCGG